MRLPTPSVLLSPLVALAAAVPLAGQTAPRPQPSTPPTSAAVDSLRAHIERRAAEVPGAVVAVAYRDLAPRADGESFDVNRDSVFHAASTMKVPVMIELVRQSESGALALDQGILLVNQFGSIVDGSPYSLDPKDDSDSALYARVGDRVTVRELMDRMITRSSNLATNAVIALVGARRVDSVAHAMGASHIRVLRGVEDGKAFERGLNNTTTAPDLATLLAAIASGHAASPAGTTLMLDVLSRQEFNDEIPAGLPAGTRVAHKTGWITGVLHDAAIVYPAGRPPYVLVVLTRGIPDDKVARALIVDVSRMVYDHAAGSLGAAGGR